MNCPVCKEVSLVLADRQGIEIDYCPQCRGVWLDRGELDKLIERGAATISTTRDHRPQQDRRPTEQRDHEYYDDDDRYSREKKKKRGFLGDLFDFD